MVRLSHRQALTTAWTNIFSVHLPGIQNSFPQAGQLLLRANFLEEPFARMLAVTQGAICLFPSFPPSSEMGSLHRQVVFAQPSAGLGSLWEWGSNVGEGLLPVAHLPLPLPTVCDVQGRDLCSCG